MLTITVTVTYRGQTIALSGEFESIDNVLDELSRQDYSVDFFTSFSTATINNGPAIDLTDESTSDAGPFTPVKADDHITFYE